jgi:hypothetical protein
MLADQSRVREQIRMTLNTPLVYVRSSMAPRSVRFGVRSRKLSNVGQSLYVRDQKFYFLELLAVVSTQQPALGPRGVLWPLCLIHKKGLCLRSGAINRLMMVKC